MAVSLEELAVAAGASARRMIDAGKTQEERMRKQEVRIVGRTVDDFVAKGGQTCAGTLSKSALSRSASLCESLEQFQSMLRFWTGERTFWERNSIPLRRQSTLLNDAG